MAASSFCAPRASGPRIIPLHTVPPAVRAVSRDLFHAKYSPRALNYACTCARIVVRPRGPFLEAGARLWLIRGPRVEVLF